MSASTVELAGKLLNYTDALKNFNEKLRSLTNSLRQNVRARVFLQ